jgi:hypothetical protein
LIASFSSNRIRHKSRYDKCDAMFVPGGHIPMQDLLKDKEEQSKGFLNGGHMKLFPQDGLAAAGG